MQLASADLALGSVHMHTVARVVVLKEADSQLSKTDISATVQQFGDYITLTDKLMFTTTDPVLTEANSVLAQQAGNTLDQLARDTMIAGTTIQYASTAAARTDITAAMKMNLAEVQEAVRTLKQNNADKITEMIDPSDGVNTSPVDAAFIGFVHPNTSFDLKNATGFIRVEQYGQRKALPGEIGSRRVASLRTRRWISWHRLMAYRRLSDFQYSILHNARRPRGTKVQAIVEAIPDVEMLLALQPEELGAKLLFILRKDQSFQQARPLNVQYFVGDQLFRNSNHPTIVYPEARKTEVVLAIAEAWAWLEAQGLLIPAPDMNGPAGFRVLSRRARSYENPEQFVRYEVGRRIPKESLHPRIAQTVWMAFVRGEFDVAVLHAMKAVEVAVREAAGLSDAHFGTKMMRTAFNPEEGVLTDKTTESAERIARMELFAGAIGSYKNPQSHRDVKLDNPAEAIEIILLANHLLRIVDARKGQ